MKTMTYSQAIESALRLRERLFAGREEELVTWAFQADATDARSLERGLQGRAIDVLIADLPYGRDSQWKRLQEDGVPSCSPQLQMLDALLAVTSARTNAPAIVAVSAAKGQKLVHPAYRRVERFRLGKRQVTLLKPVPV